MKFGCVIQNEGRRGWVTCGSFFLVGQGTKGEIVCTGSELQE